MMNQSSRVTIFDTTLRDGEQSPGASMNLTEKLVIAKALSELGVDVIEAGFPAASKGDAEAVCAIAQSGLNPTIAALARCHDSDIETAARCLEGSHNARLHVFLATSPIHRQHKLKMSRQEVLARVRAGVHTALGYCSDIEFSAEDGSRTEPDFLKDVLLCAAESGARTLNIPDTVGYAMPGPFGRMIAELAAALADHDVLISVHCHNDLGMAVANSLAAVQAGARQVECTINGIGERAGNCSLEEIVMALKTRRDVFGLETGIVTPKIYPTSRLVSNVTGLHVQRNKAVVGENAFAHEAGIHQHGMLQHQSTYEIMRPQEVGLSSNRMVLGKHSGRHAFRDWLDKNGYRLDSDHFEATFGAFKRLADQKKNLFDGDLEALVETGLQERGPWQLVSSHISAGSGSVPTASVDLVHPNRGRVEEAACGQGPVEALFRAIEKALGLEVELMNYQLKSVSMGIDAQGEVSLEVLHNGTVHQGRAFSTDIIEASALAFLNVLNGFIRESEEHPLNDLAIDSSLSGRSVPEITA